jgi:Na+-driven multidrug efflux pump
VNSTLPTEEELRRKTRDTLWERGLDSVLSFTDVLYPLALGSWALLISSQVTAFLYLTGAIFTGINIAVVSLVPKNLGAKKKEKAREFLNQSLLVIGIIGIALGSIIVFLSETLLRWQGISNEQITAGRAYFQIFGGCYFLISGVRWNLAVNLRSSGDTESPKRASLVICVLNLVLDPLLMFEMGLGLGLVGSALGTIIAQIIGIGYLWLCFRRSELSHIKTSWRLTRDIQKELFKIGVPVMAKEAAKRGEQLLMNLLVIQLGTTVLAAYRIWIMVRPPLIDTIGLATGNTAQTYIAKLVGKSEKKADSTLKKEYDLVLKICIKNCDRLVKYGILISILLILVVAFVYMPLVDTEAEGKWYLLTFSLGIIGWVYSPQNIVLDYVLMGAQKSGTSLIVTLLRQGTLIVLTWFSVHFLTSNVYLGIIGVAGSYLISILVYRVLLHKLSSKVLG